MWIQEPLQSWIQQKCISKIEILACFQFSTNKKKEKIESTKYAPICNFKNQ
jgi:hypothetical protein